MLYYTNINTKIGKLGLVRNDENLLKIHLPNEKLTNILIKTLFPNDKIIETEVGFKEIISQISDYLDGKRTSFTINAKFDVSPFYNRVLKEVAKVPYGTTVSYSQIAKKLNNPKAVRAVGSANARNPLPIIIPCHRIIANNGKLGGYGGGINLKKYLIEFEKLILKTTN